MLLTIFQALLIGGSPLGNFAWGGAHTVLPAKYRVGSAVAIALYAVFSMFLLSKAGIVSIIGNSFVLQVGMWLITAYFTLGIVVNAISRSKKERYVMTPVAAALAVIFLIVTLH